MLLGVSYEKALLAIGLESVIEHGTYIIELKRAAKMLGKPLRNRKRFDIESDTGILMVKSPNWPSHHLVVLKDGLVIDTDATIWDVDVFLAGYTATVIGLLAL